MSVALAEQVERLGAVVSQLRQKGEGTVFGEWLEAVNPTWKWDWPYLRYVRERLDAVTRGRVRRLTLLMPPRHGKSQLATIRYPVWRLTREPDLRVIIGCYNQNLANKFSRAARRLAQGRVPLASDRTAVEDWETAAGGGVRAVGVGSGVTGHGGDLIIVDDPIRSREEAESETYRERVWEWFKDDLYTRQEPGAAIILIQTAWHHDDLAGRLLSEAAAGGDPWEFVRLPALAEADDPLGRKEGEALCPARFPAEELDRIRCMLGEYSFAALYQQQPAPREGGFFDLRRIVHAPARPEGLRVYQAWDLAISERATADYTACATIGVDGDQNAYLLDMDRRRASFNETLGRMAVLAERWKPISIGIETSGYQAAAFQEATRRFMLPFKELKPDRDKGTRAQLLAARMEAGKLYANKAAPWWREWEGEALQFPSGTHDDQVDATCHALLLAGEPEVVFEFF